MTRRPPSSIVANPVLIGAITVLVTTVAVFLAYNANSGLPFVPTQRLNVELENGADVVPGVEVFEGGYRIGIVEEMRPARLSSGRVGAILALKLDESATPIPADTRITVRPRSALAMKIVQFERGTSNRSLEDGDRLPVGQTFISTDLDEYFTLYDEPTRVGTKRGVTGFGTALAGRGLALNETIRNLPGFFGFLEPVMRNLAAERTRLPDLFKELADVTRVVAPVADRYASSFGFQADTYEAISRDPQALKDTIAKSPPTMDASIRSFRVQRPFLRDTAAFSRDLEAVAGDLKGALPTINTALEVGTPVTRRTVALNRRFGRSLGALRDLAREPTTNGALRGLAATVGTLNPQLRFLGPYVTVCNYWNIFWTFAAEHFTAPDPTGGSQRVLLNNGDEQHDALASELGANEFANGEGIRPGPQSSDDIRQYLHGNTTGGNAIRPDGRADCTAGQQGYTYDAYSHDTTEGNFYNRVVVDQLNGLLEPPAKGSTYNKFDRAGRGHGRNRPRVPEGQTFSVIPQGRGAKTDFDRAWEAHLERTGQLPKERGR